MAQYKTGTCNVTNNSSVITGNGTLWLSNLTAGKSTFKINGSNVIYTVASVDSDTQIHLNSVYAGATANELNYICSNDFTPNYNLYEPDFNDTDWPVHLRESMRKIDSNVINSDLEKDSLLEKRKNISFSGSGFVVEDFKNNNLWNINSVSDRNMYGGSYPDKKNKLGAFVQGAIGTVFSEVSNDSFVSSLKRIDYTFKKLSEFGVKSIGDQAIPSDWLNFYTGLERYITQDDLAALDWSNVDRVIENCRKYGIPIQLRLPTQAEPWFMAQCDRWYNGWLLPIAEFVAKRYKNDYDIIRSIEPMSEFYYKFRAVLLDSTSYLNSNPLDVRWMEYQEGVYNIIKTYAPNLKVQLSSAVNTEVYEILEQLIAAGKQNIFDNVVDIHIYRTYLEMPAPDYYSSTFTGVSATGWITDIITLLDNNNMSDRFVQVGEFGNFWRSRSTFTFTNNSNSVLASNADFRLPAGGQGYVPIVDGDEIYISTDSNTIYIVSNVTDSGFDITPSYSGNSVSGVYVFNRTQELYSCNAIEQFFNWALTEDRLISIHNWAFWGTGYVAKHDLRTAYKGGGWLLTDSYILTKLGDKIKDLLGRNGIFTRFSIPNGELLDIPNYLPKGELVSSEDRMYLGQGDFLPRKRIDSGTIVTEDNLIGLGTDKPKAPFHISNTNPNDFNVGLVDLKSNIILTSDTSSIFSTITASEIATVRGSFRGCRSRGTFESPTPPLKDDIVFSILGSIFTGSGNPTEPYNTAEISFIADDNITSGIAPQRIVFRNRTNGSGPMVERITIKASGNIGFGVLEPSEAVEVAGYIKSQTGFKFPDNSIQTTATIVTTSLTSTSNTDALAASAGKVLSDRIPVISLGYVPYSIGSAYTGHSYFTYNYTSNILNIGCNSINGTTGVTDSQTSIDGGLYHRTYNTSNGVNATSSMIAKTDIAQCRVMAHGSGRTATRYGTILSGVCEVLADAGNGLLIGTNNISKPIIFGNTSVERCRIDENGEFKVGPLALAIGTTGITVEGGMYTCYVAAENLTAGDIVYFAQSGTADYVTKVPVNEDMPIGIVYNGVTSGNVVKIIWGGRAAVMFTSAPSKGYIGHVSTSVAGQADSAATIPATTTHFREIGHVTGASVSKESRTLYYVQLHFN